MAAVFALGGCAWLGLGDQTVALPQAQGYPDIGAWGSAVAVVHDDDAQTTRRIFRSPGGQIWAKVHHPLRRPSVITRIDVRRVSPGGKFAGWRYESWDPARRAPIEADAETCHLCHSMAPSNGTYTQKAVRR